MKILTFWETWWISIKVLGKIKLMMILKVTIKQSFALSSDSNFWNVFLGLKHGFSLSKISILVFVELAIFHSIRVRTSLGQIARHKVWCLIYAFWCLSTYVTYTKLSAHLHNKIHWFYGNCWTLDTKVGKISIYFCSHTENCCFCHSFPKIT